MHLKKIKPLEVSKKVENDKPYAGKVIDYAYDKKNNELCLKVKFVKDDENIYEIAKKVDFTEDSEFLAFCGHMSVYDYEDINIDFSEFIDLPVICTLYTDDKGATKIDFIDFFWECYTDREDYQEFFRLTDDEMMEFFYGDIFNLYNGNVASNEKQGGAKYEIQKD